MVGFLNTPEAIAQMGFEVKADSTKSDSVAVDDTSSIFDQDPYEDKEDDPFKNDPFFNKPITDFFDDKPTFNVESEVIRRSFYQLHKKGIDYQVDLQNGPYRTSILYGVFPVLPMVHFNRVSGLHLGFNQDRMQWYNNGFLDIPSVNVHGSIGYSFGRETWPYMVGMDIIPGRKKRFMMGGEYHNSTTTDDYWRVGLTETSFTSLFAAYDYLDYYHVEGVGAYTLLRGKRFFEIGAAFLSDEYSSANVNTRYSFFGKKKTYRPNPNISEGRIQSLYLGGSFNPKELVLLPGFTFRLDLLAELAHMSYLESDYSFSRYMLESRTSLRIPPGGMFEWRFRSGMLGGDMPLQRLFEAGGIGSMRGRSYKEFVGNSMVLNNIQFHFGSPSHSDNEWVDLDNFRITLFLDSGWAEADNGLFDEDKPTSIFGTFSFEELRHDVGVGLGSDIIRFEMAWRTEDLESTPVMWIRFNPTFI